MAQAKPIEIHNLGTIGLIRDRPAHLIPPEAWSDSNNVRFQDNNAVKFKGHAQIFGTPTVAPGFGLHVPSASQNFWIYCSKTKAYVYEGGVHTNITRQTASVDVNYTAAEFREWQGGLLGGIPILNNGADVPQFWGTLNVATKLANLTNWPSTLRAKIVRPFGPFLVALNINDNGTTYPHMFWWSHPADPGSLPSSWDYTDATKDAGRKELTDVEGGQILEALMLRNMLIVYKEASTHWIRFVGGKEKMANDQLFVSSGILAPRCVALVDKGRKHFVATADDIIQHNGQDIKSVLDAKMRKYLQNDLDQQNSLNSFCMHHPAQREAWFCYPSAGQTFPNKALIWNYGEDTLQVRDFNGLYGTTGTTQTSGGTAWSSLTNLWEANLEPWATEGKRQTVFFDPNTTKIYRVDSGETFDGTNPLAFVERTGLAVIGKDRQGQPKVNFSNRKLLKRIWPKVSGTAQLSIRAGAQEDRNGVITWEPAQTFNPTTQKYLDFTANGRLLAVRFESSDGLPWQLEGYDIEVDLLGDL
jgi:hypothetical protein